MPLLETETATPIFSRALCGLRCIQGQHTYLAHYECERPVTGPVLTLSDLRGSKKKPRMIWNPLEWLLPLTPTPAAPFNPSPPAIAEGRGADPIDRSFDPLGPIPTVC